MRTLFLLLSIPFAYHSFAQTGTDSAKAEQYYAQNKYPEALAAAESEIEGGNNTQDNWRIKGDCLQKAEKYVAAIQAYEKAQKLGEPNALLETNMGAAYLNLEQYPEAEKKLKKALKMDPNLAEAHYFTGNLHYAQFNTQSAWRHYNQAVSLRSNYKEALFMRAATYAEQEKYGEALADYQSVLEIDPEMITAKFNIAILKVENEDYAEALLDLQSIPIKSLPNVADYHFYLGEALYFSGKREDACTQYQLAAKYGDTESADIYQQYCMNREERKAAAKKRTIRMAF